MATTVLRHRFTTADYHKMGEAGILDEDDRVELIEGELVDMTPVGRRHMACADRLAELFIRGLGEKAIVRVQGAIRLSEHSEPQPDLILLRRRPDFYAEVDARPEDVWLIVEVADTSLPYERGVKAPLYARSGIPEFWLVDLTGRSISLFRDPGPDGYRTVLVVQGSEPLTVQAFPELPLTGDQILG